MPLDMEYWVFCWNGKNIKNDFDTFGINIYMILEKSKYFKI